MSQRALCLAVRDRIRAALGVGDEACRCTSGPEPPAFSGAYFVAVHAGDWQGAQAEGVGESFGVQATVTLRCADVPEDQLGEEAWLRTTDGLEALLRRVVVAVVTDRGTAADPTVLNRANAYIAQAAVPTNGVATKLRLLDGGRPDPKRADWVGARASTHATQPAAIAQTLRFGGAERYQRYQDYSTLG